MIHRPAQAIPSQRQARNLVAQVSQNMNFLIDMCIEDFLSMHARVRNIADPARTLREVLAITNQLAGEPRSRTFRNLH